MTLRKAIKQNAKRALKGHWGRALLILLVFIGVNILLSILDNAIFSTFGFHRVSFSLNYSGLRQIIIGNPDALPGIGEVVLSLALLLVRLVFIAPLSIGIINWVLELSDGRVDSVGSLFWVFEHASFRRSIWLEITVAVKIALFGLAVSLVPIAMFTAGLILSISGLISWEFYILLVVIGGVLLLFTGGILTMWFSARYFAAPLLLCRRYGFTVREATKCSVAATATHRWQIVSFYLSFLPWLLLCALVLPLLYVVPYITVSSVLMARYLYEDYRMGTDPAAKADCEVCDNRSDDGLADSAAAEDIPVPGAETPSPEQETTEKE